MILSNDLADLAFVSAEAAAFVATHDMAALPDGRYELPGGNYVNVMSYETKARDVAVYEAHDQFADIQLVLQGEEFIEVHSREGLGEPTEINLEADYLLYDGATSGDVFLMRPGWFCAVMPEDAHMPGVRVAESIPVKKAVFKIAVA